MAGRVSLPNNLTGAVLNPSGEGVSVGGSLNASPASVPGFIMPPTPNASPAELKPSVPLMPQPALTPQSAMSFQPPITNNSQILPGTTPSVITEAKAQKPGYSFNPLNIIWLILIFIAVFLILYTTKLNMVTDLVNGERIINGNKLIFWSILISLIIAVLGFVIVKMWNGRRSDA